MLSSNSASHLGSWATMICVSMPRAATRPKVEKSAEAPTPS